MAVYRPKYRDSKTGGLVLSGFWWYEFTFAGRRVRESAKTTRKTVAVEAEKHRRAQLERVHAGMPTEKPEHRIRTISAVLKEYRAAYPVNHREKSVLMVKNRGAHLLRLLGALVPSDMTAQRVIEYMEKRRSEGAGRLWPRVKRLEETTTLAARSNRAKNKRSSMRLRAINRA